MNLVTTVGIELEFSGSSLARVERELRDRNVDCTNFARWRHSPGNTWDLKTDSSCGWEAVSPVLETYEQLVDAAGVGQLITTAGGEATERCGLHVHVGTGNLSHQQLENMFRFLTRYEWAFFLMVPPERRTNIYCKRLPLSTIQAIKRPQFNRNDWWIHAWHDKNVWLNGRRWPDIHTLEFRLMPGSLSQHFIIGYVTFLQWVITSVKDRTINWGVASSKDDRSLFQTMLGQSGFYGPWTTPDQKELSLTGRKWALERYKIANGLMVARGGVGDYRATSLIPVIPTVDVRPSWERGVRPPRPRRRRPTTPVPQPVDGQYEMPPSPAQYVPANPVTIQSTVVTSPINTTSTSGDWVVSWGQGTNATSNVVPTIVPTTPVTVSPVAAYWSMDDVSEILPPASERDEAPTPPQEPPAPPQNQAS